ncbi:MAG TPA: ABC transporter permease [Terriglobales bacterium]|nr:ABC transporter permease [Terriglobales bacterium]
MNLVAHLRYAFRQFRRAPVFTAAAVLTLALGIGGTTAIFSLIHSVMLRSLPVADPASLYRIGDGNDCCVEGGPQDRWGMVSYALYLRFKENLPEFDELAAFQAGQVGMGVRRASERLAKPLPSEFVTGNYFSTFGIRPFAGRLLSVADDQASSPPVAVLSYHVWQAAYGGDPAVVGSTFVLDGHPFTIAGIAPPGFFGDTLRADPAAVFLPLQQEPLVRGSASLLRQQGSAWLRIIGRLRRGKSVAGMSARLTGVLRQWLLKDSGYPAAWMEDIERVLPKQTITVVPAGAGIADMKEDYGRSLEILLAVCGLVLLIACANVANLMLARAAARRSQTAVRLAIGASQGRIIAQAIAESVLLASLGGVAGLVVAVAASRLLLSLAFHSAHFLPISTAPTLAVLGFALAVSLLTGVLFGTAPAWLAMRTSPVEALRSGTRTTRDRASLARKGLLMVQATLSVVLVAAATMLGRSLSHLEHQDIGFETANRVMVQLNIPVGGSTPPRLNAFNRELEDRLKRVPGVKQAGLAMYNPMTDNMGELIEVEGHPPAKFNEDAGSSWDRVSAGYFQTVGQPIVRGRGFTAADNENTAPVAIVNQAFVRRFFPREEPLDKHFGLDMPENAGTFRVVGVARDAKYAPWSISEATLPMFFVPLAQWVHYPPPSGGDTPFPLDKLELLSHYIGGVALVTRSSPGQVEQVVTKVLSDFDPNVTVTEVRTLQQMIDRAVDQQRAVASLAGLFGIVALLLAAVGLYGVTAYTVAQRTNEIGVRMALGADRVRVVNLVLRQAFQRVVAGLVAGIPLAIGAGRLITSELYGVKSWDPAALAVAVISLGLSALFAAIVPALRAAGISPTDALRAE